MFAQTADGTKIQYALSGAGPGRVALVHSLALDHRFWAPVAQRLAEDAQVLALDCRGHGASGKPAGPYTAELFADDLAAVLTHAGWDEVVVCGASMGGCVALAFADRHADRCAGLGLFDTTAWYGDSARAVWEDRAQKAMTAGLGSLTQFQLTRWFSDAFRSEHADEAAGWGEIFAGNDVRAYAEACRMLGAVDLRARLPMIAARTRIVVGEEDDATPPSMAQALHAGIGGSSLTVIPGRHLTPLESPERVAEEIRRLIQDRTV